MRGKEQAMGLILVVEDEDELRFLLGAHLRASGFDVIATRDGESAVRLAEERQPDVVIMDLGLPILDGIEATRMLKAGATTAHIPVIMLTARSGTTDVVRGLEAGAQEYLPKPFDVAELLARVQTVYRLAVTCKRLDHLNSQLEAEVDVKTRRLQLLYEYLRDLNHADTRDEVLDLLVRCTEQTTTGQRITVFLVDARGEQLVCERAVGLEPATIEPLPLNGYKGITGRVFQSGKALAARTRGGFVDDKPPYKGDVFLSAPLISTSLKTCEGVIGVINVTEKADDAPFTDEEIECIQTLADAAAIALDNLLRRQRLQQSVRVLLNTVGLLAEYRDDETTQHLARVARLSQILAESLRREGPYASLVTSDFIDSLAKSAPMHDIGKVGIPDDILTKPGKLTEEEFEVMKTHTEIGRRVLSQAEDPEHHVPLLQMCIDIAYCHHEQWDGLGYPNGLSRGAIPLAARIIALVDAYDAMTSRRRYKEAMSHELAVEEIRCESGRHFDPVIVEAFLRCHEAFNRVREGQEASAALVGSDAR